MNDKELEELNIFKSRSIRKQEKIEKALQEIHDFKRLYVEQPIRYERLLKEIVKILEE